MSVLMKIVCNGKISIIEITKKPIVLGRSTEANFTVPDNECSSKHCELRLVDQVTVIKDLNSKNGTYVNGSLQKETVIYLGDEIRIGSTKISLDNSKMNEDELNYHTLNITRKQNHMIKLDDLGFDKMNSKAWIEEKVKSPSPRDITKRTQIPKIQPWWKKILSFIFKK
ncbi:MAG: FHA domain-containing protein [Bacteriovoracaceae bacterium]